MKSSTINVLISITVIASWVVDGFVPQNKRIHQTPKCNAPILPHPSYVPSSKQKPLESSLRLFYQDDDTRESSLDRQREYERKVNNFLRASQRSFQNVESMTNRLLNRQPLIALVIFITAGAIVAYLMGLIFLGGYIETWNPAENDAIPYWDEEILIISRKVGR